jgi:cytochrome P450
LSLGSNEENQNCQGRNKDNAATDNSENTVFHSLLVNSNVPDSDKTDDRMAEEARILLLGGTDTTAMTLSAITYHILSNPSIFKQLKAELTQAIPDPDSLPVSSMIEALPYLTAVIEEGIRLHPAGSGRQERVTPMKTSFIKIRKEEEDT